MLSYVMLTMLLQLIMSFMMYLTLICSNRTANYVIYDVSYIDM